MGKSSLPCTGRTTISLSEELRERLNDLKPYESMSYNDLVDEMADLYEAEAL